MLEALKEKDYIAAQNIFDQLDTFKDSPTMLKEADYQIANEHFNTGDFETAIQLFDELGNYSDSRDRKLEAQLYSLQPISAATEKHWSMASLHIKQLRLF